jgi:hypothetical protein
MQIDNALIQRMTSFIEGLNVRLARLASAWHVPLDDPSALRALMDALYF